MTTTATAHAPMDATIVNAAVYPSIGVARIGNSLTDRYLGAEVPDPLPCRLARTATAPGH
jgi:hypothetical protein